MLNKNYVKTQPNMERYIPDVIAWNLLEQLLEVCPHIYVNSSDERHRVYLCAWDVDSDIMASRVSASCHTVHCLDRLDRITIEAAHEVSFRWIPGSSAWTTVDDSILERLVGDSYKHKVVLVYDARLFC